MKPPLLLEAVSGMDLKREGANISLAIKFLGRGGAGSPSVHFDRRVWFTNYSDGTCCQHVPFLILRLLDIYGFPLLSALDNVRLFNQFQYLIDIFVTRCFDSEFPLF